MSCFKYTLYILLFFNVSCIHTKPKVDLITQDAVELTLKEQFNFSDPEDLEEQISKIGPLSNEKNQEKFVRILRAFNNLKKDLNKNEISILPQSKTKLEIDSFCALPDKSIPGANELFSWVKGVPDSPLVRPILNLYSHSLSIDKEAVQEIIWNLANKTYYEDYPEDLKIILNKASPSARVALPSKVRDRILNRIIPEEFKSPLELLIGQYYNANKFKQLIANKKSKQKLPLNYKASRIPDSKLLASSQSNDFDSQSIVFYNPSDQIQTVDLNEYYLSPLRDDVQPILLSSVISNIDEIQNILDKYSMELLGYVGSQYPSANPLEKELVKEMPTKAAMVFFYAILAENYGEKYFPGTSENGQSDAFRHYVWSGLLLRELVLHQISFSRC